MKSNIRKLRNERNLSQTELAKVIGKTQQAVSHMEKDRDRISIESLITMADYFGVSTDYVLGIEPEENSRDSDIAEDKNPQIIAESKSLVSENKKILYQLILTLLLDSIDDDTQSIITRLGSNV